MKPKVITFFLQMPEPIAIPHDTIYTFQVGERIPEIEGLPSYQTESSPALPFSDYARPFVSFRFWQYQTKHKFDDASEGLEAVMRAVLPPRLHPRKGDRQEPDPIDAYETVVEACALIDGETDIGEETERAFTLCIDQLQQVLRAYQITTKHHVPVLTRHRLQTVIPLVTRDAATNEWSDSLSLYITSVYTKSPPSEPPLDKVGMDKLTDGLQQIMRRNPVMIINERMVMARYALDKTGDYASAVIHAHIAVEVLMDSVLTFILFETGETVEEAAAIFSESAQKRIRTHFGKWLGGDWNPNTSKSIRQWAKILAPLRNQIVHMGYLPSYEEAYEALEIVPSIAEFVLDRVVHKRLRYPHTALVLLGRKGLEEHKAWTRKIIDISETLNIPIWLQSFNRWREAVEKQTNMPKRVE